VLLIPNNTQSFLQNATAASCAPAYPTCIAQVADQNAVTFDLKSHRHIADFAGSYLVNQDLTINGAFKHATRAGNLPLGGSFGLGATAVELPAPIDHRLDDVDVNAEYSHGAFMVRGGYTGSFFHNNITEHVWDNPFRVTDQTPTTGTAPNVSSLPMQARMPTAPSSSFFTVNGMASFKMAQRTRVTAYVSKGTLKDASDTTILPMTINSALPVIPLERSTVDGEAGTKTFSLTFTSRPKNVVDVTARYRYYDYDNRVPEFGYTARVGYDTAVQTSTNDRTVRPHPQDVRRRWALHDEERRRPASGIPTTRKTAPSAFESSSENTFRPVADAALRAYASVRASLRALDAHGDA
jgi:hypothetical protein